MIFFPHSQFFYVSISFHGRGRGKALQTLLNIFVFTNRYFFFWILNSLPQLYFLMPFFFSFHLFTDFRISFFLQNRWGKFGRIYNPDYHWTNYDVDLLIWRKHPTFRFLQQNCYLFVVNSCATSNFRFDFIFLYFVFNLQCVVLSLEQFWQWWRLG